MSYLIWRKAWRAVRMAKGEQAMLPSFPLRGAALMAYAIR